MTPRPANPRLAYDILRVTADIIEEKGAESLTMREVAERLGYSATTIYLYFKNKDELLQGTIDRSFEWFAEAMDVAESGDRSTEALRKRSLAYVDWALDHPEMYRLMFERPMTAAPSEDSAVLRRRAWRRTAEVIDELIESRGLKCFEEVELMTNLIWATLHGLASLAISGRMFGPAHVTSVEIVREKVHFMVSASFEQWMRVWGERVPETNLYGACQRTGEGDANCGDGEDCGCGDEGRGDAEPAASACSDPSCG